MKKNCGGEKRNSQYTTLQLINKSLYFYGTLVIVEHLIINFLEIQIAFIDGCCILLEILTLVFLFRNVYLIKIKL